ARATDVADLRMPGERPVQLPAEQVSHGLHAGEQPVVAQPALHGEGAGTGGRMAYVRVSVLESTAACRDCIPDMPARNQSADRLVAGAEAFSDYDNVWHDAFALECPQPAPAPHAAHPLVEDEEHPMAVAPPAHPPEIALHRRHRAERGPGDGLCNERDHRGWPEPHDLVLELRSEALGVRGFGFA